MKLILIKIGKAIKTLQREGFINGGRRILKSFLAMFGRVKAGDILMEFETNKVSNTIEAPVDGYVLKIMVNEGDEKNIRDALCYIGEKDEVVQGAE